MTILPCCFGGLKKMFDLSEVRVRIAVVNQGVEVLRGFPDALLAAREAEVLLFLG
jgi:hypothetical protein